MAESGEAQAAQHTAESKVSKPDRSCVWYFEQLWWCTGPRTQLVEYYRTGQLANCGPHWRALKDCVYGRTKWGKAEAAAAPPAPDHALWQFRTKDEAHEFWSKEFNHDPDNATADGNAEAQPASNDHNEETND